MNSTSSVDNFSRQISDFITANAESHKDQSVLLRKVFDKSCEYLNKNTDATNHISAPNVVVEIIDSNNGSLFRRYLEVEYDETDNGLRLIGEDMAGASAQIVFLSESAIERMHELRGKGPNQPRCDD